MRFVSRVPVRFSDLDGFGHVNHATYLTYCEDSRTELFTEMGRESGLPLLQARFVVVSLRCDYHLPLDLELGAVTVRCAVETIGTSSVGLDYEVCAGEEVAASIHEVLVATGDDGSARPVTAAEREFLARFLVVEEPPTAGRKT